MINVVLILLRLKQNSQEIMLKDNIIALFALMGMLIESSSCNFTLM